MVYKKLWIRWIMKFFYEKKTVVLAQRGKCSNIREINFQTVGSTFHTVFARKSLKVCQVWSIALGPIVSFVYK